MSVRRLAPAEQQPKSFKFTPKSLEVVKFWMGKYPEDRKRSAVIPLLWVAQKQEGWVSEPAIQLIAEMLEMPVIRVLEVATFYTMFHLHPVGKNVFQVCGTTPCMLRGANDLKAACKKHMGPKDTVSKDGLFTWQEVECLGACANAPMVQINDYYYEDLTVESLEKLIADFKAGKKPKPGPYVKRFNSAPEGGEKTLLDPALYDGHLGKPAKTLPNAPTTGKSKKEKA